jgi:periplasmic divalent cation tolerance protein
MGSYDGRLYVVTTTLPGVDQAEQLAAVLVERGLAVCAQVGSGLTTCYRWQGRTEYAQEVGLVLKVRDDRLQACLQFLRTEHPYDVPQLTAWPVTLVDEAYGRWAWGEDA